MTKCPKCGRNTTLRGDKMSSSLRKFYDSFTPSDRNPHFSTTECDLGYFDNMLANPDHFRTNKNVEFKIVWMTPEQYFTAALTGFKVNDAHSYNSTGTPELWSKYMGEHVAKIKTKMELGEVFPLPNLEYQADPYKSYFGQEGRSRIAAAYLLGDKEVPVLIAYPADLKSRKIASDRMSPYVRKIVFGEN